MKLFYRILLPILCIFVLLTACGDPYNAPAVSVPALDSAAYTQMNGNQPLFTNEDLTVQSYESYSPLDQLGRCGVAMACIGQDIMPTEERGAIGQVKPTGWHTVKYDSVDGKYLYNRCHLIGYQLTGENANERNLITGTRYLNTEGMLPFENQIAEYVNETNNHVLYRVTPVFEGTNLLASGVTLEAKSVEDNGKGLCFYVYCPNVQPGIEIDYATGKSKLIGENSLNEQSSPLPSEGEIKEYVLNRNSKTFHLADCSSVEKIKEANREDFIGERQVVIDAGYSPCGNCKP